MRAVRYIFLTVSLGLIGFLAWWLYWPDPRLLAKDAIENAGGLVLISENSSDPDVMVMLRPGVTQEELEQLTAMDVLQPRFVRITPYSTVNDRGLVWLTRYPDLHTLLLERAQITDEGLSTLKRFEKLRVLALDSCPITDRGLETIQDLAALQRVSLFGTRVTAEGVNTLQAARPELKIFSRFMKPDRPRPKRAAVGKKALVF